jgi:lipid-A-disaccharide synthase
VRKIENKLVVLIVAGEASGDLHGAGVVRELKRLAPEAEIFGIGGNGMQAAGMELLFHIREMAVVGLPKFCGICVFRRRRLRSKIIARCRRRRRAH